MYKYISETPQEIPQMNTIDIITEKIEQLFAGDFSGHDVQHSIRVYKNACLIAESEECDKEIVSLAALLHDADDVKLFHTEQYANAKKQHETLSQAPLMKTPFTPLLLK